ncbi:MAG: quinolinate synthase NadA [Syntrophobacteraceae bacterium]|jgi:quinolinate synthase|nr:quinolinate synthase NadA [Syntrophobacteraceae bacterium]
MMAREILQQISEIRARRRAIILAHNYQPPEIQEIADLTGDSLELSRKAAQTDASVIVFCGVAFMAETAAILNPEKIVLLPRPEAGCPMADMITPEDMRRIRSEHPGVPIVTYVNSTAAVKAESDACCTSANSIRVVSSFSRAPAVYMAPDQNLAQYTAAHTSSPILHWHGYCPFHHALQPDEVLRRKEEHPGALFLAHPECRPSVLALADEVTSTSGMLRFVKESSHERFIIGTEVGILHPMGKSSPGKEFFPASEKMFCPHMKMISLDDILHSLETLEPRVSVPEDIRIRALHAVQRMLHLG